MKAAREAAGEGAKVGPGSQEENFIVTSLMHNRVLP